MTWSSGFSDVDAAEILSMPKVIGEKLKWKRSRDGRQFRRSARLTVLPDNRPSFDRDMFLYIDCYQSRTGQQCWGIGLQVSGLRETLVRFDNHDKPHMNADGQFIHGCMIHLWSEDFGLKEASSASEILNCSSVDYALIGALQFCNIRMLENYQMQWDGSSHG